MNISLLSEIRLARKQLISLGLGWLIFCLIFVFGIYLFHRQSVTASDLMGHLNFVNLFVIEGFKFPEVGLEYTIYALSKVFKIEYAISATFLLSITLVALSFIISFIFKNFLQATFLNSAFLALVMLIPSAIYLPFFNKYLYLGQGSPNVWHSPTLLMIKPLAFLVTLATVFAINNQHKLSWFLGSILLMISMFYKPSLAMVFIPALGAYVLINHRKNFYTYLYSSLMVLPSFLFLIWQTWILLRYGYPSGKHDSIMISIFGVLHLYTPNVFISLILGIAFPLSLIILRPTVLHNNYLQFSWLMLFFGYIQMAFLAEKGVAFSNGNFFWGYLVVMQEVFVFSFVEFYRWVLASYYEGQVKNWSIKFVGLIFFLHFFSGIYFLFRIITKGNYF